MLKGFILGVIVALPLGAVAQGTKTYGQVDATASWPLSVDRDSYVRAGGRDDDSNNHPIRMNKAGDVICVLDWTAKNAYGEMIAPREAGH